MLFFFPLRYPLFFLLVEVGVDFLLGFLCLRMDHEFADDVFCVAGLDVDIAEDAADDSADEVDQEIFHGVDDADVQVAAFYDDLLAIGCLYDGF